MRYPISVTIGEDNLLWLRAQAASAKGSVSAVLDRLVTGARLQGRSHPDAIRTVVGTIDLAGDDPDLEHADEYLRGLFDRSLRRPLLVKDTPPDTPKTKRRV